MNRWLRTLGPLLVLLVFGGAIWLLHRELAAYHYRDLKQSIHQIPLGSLVAAVALTALNYVILMGYDLLAIRYLRHPIPLAKVAMTSFIGHVSSFNFGTLLGGTSVRYRLYSAWGLSAVEILQLIAILGLTFWLGVFALAGIAFVVDPLTVPPRLHLPFSNVRGLGLALLAATAAYLALGWLRRRPIRVFGWELILPPPGPTLGQIAIASADLLVAAGVLYVLLPPAIDVSYPAFLGIYLLAVVAAVFTHVPGGLGVFELGVLVMLSPSDSPQVMGSLLVFRGVYYFLPLAMAAGLLGGYELLSRRETLRQVADRIGLSVAPAAPRLLALLCVLAGAVLLLSGATPAAHDRLGWLRPLLPLPVIEVSHFVGSLIGMALLLLASGLQRRLDTAYWLTAGMLLLGIAVSLLKGFDYEEALILTAMLTVLLPGRPFFYRKGFSWPQPLAPRWLVAAAMVLLCSGWLGLFAYKHVEYSGDLWWQFAFEADAPRFLRATAGAATLLLGLGAAALLRPEPPRASASDPRPRELARGIAAASPDTYAQLALTGDKLLLFDTQKTAMVMYGVKGRSWIALGDPVGPADARAELAWQFHELADRYQGWTVFYQVGQENLPVYLDLGLILLKLGEEARVPLGEFSLEGSARKSLRQTSHRFERQGCALEIVPAGPSVAQAMPELRRVSDAWLAGKNAHEKGFSLGKFEEDYLVHFPIAVIRQRDAIVAFANVLCGAGQEELSIDLMRYLPEGETASGVMEYLLVELMLWGRQEGYRWFNLGMAPLSGLGDTSSSPIWSRVGTLVFQHGEHFYSFQGLRRYKEKFAPMWRPRYLASPGGLALPRVLADVTTLISGGVKALVSK